MPVTFSPMEPTTGEVTIVLQTCSYLRHMLSTAKVLLQPVDGNMSAQVD